jgi:hypothetical protein
VPEDAFWERRVILVYDLGCFSTSKRMPNKSRVEFPSRVVSNRVEIRVSLGCSLIEPLLERVMWPP